MTENNRPSILPPEMHGVMRISGYRGIGKSFLAAQADLPDNIAYFDFESKGEGIDEQLDFGLYRAPMQDMSDPIPMYQMLMSEFSSLEQDRYTVVVLDNISPFETALRAEAKSKAKHYADIYGLNAGNIIAGRYGGPSMVANIMIRDIAAKLHKRGVKLIIAISHIKNAWVGGQPMPNKFNIKGADAWDELSILSLVLIPGDKQPIPAALVRKEQLGKISISSNPSVEVLEAMKRGEQGHTIQRMLPYRIGECTFARVRWYLHNPANIETPVEGEKLVFEESDPFNEKLTPDQFKFAQAVIMQSERDEADVDELLAAAETQALDNAVSTFEDDLALLDKGLTPPQIVEKLKSNGHADVTIPQVAQALAKINKEQ